MLYLNWARVKVAIVGLLVNRSLVVFFEARSGRVCRTEILLLSLNSCIDLKYQKFTLITVQDSALFESLDQAASHPLDLNYGRRLGSQTALVLALRTDGSS